MELILSGNIDHVSLNNSEHGYTYNISAYIKMYRGYISITNMKKSHINMNELCAGDLCRIKISNELKITSTDTNKFLVSGISLHSSDNYSYLLKDNNNQEILLNFDCIDKGVKEFLGGVNPNKFFTVQVI